MKEKQVVLQILGMTCPSCAQGIESGLARLDGVILATVNFPAKEAIVKFDEEKVSLDKIKAAIKRGGYEAVERIEDVVFVFPLSDRALRSTCGGQWTGRTRRTPAC